MSAELLYRFCVREKTPTPSANSTQALFITRQFLSEAVARTRFDVVEGLYHTAIQSDTLLKHLALQGS